MKRIIITAGAALLVAVPASMGLISNASFAQSAPVSVPSQAVSVDDKGGLRNKVETGDDKGGPALTGRGPRGPQRKGR